MLDYEDWIVEIDGERPTSDLCEQALQKTETPATGVFDYGRQYWSLLFLSILIICIAIKKRG